MNNKIKRAVGIGLRAALVLAILFVIILTGLFHEMGFVIGMTILILFLTSIKSLQTPYLWPFLPFDWGALTKILLRPTMSSLKVRPSIVRPQNVKRQK